MNNLELEEVVRIAKNKYIKEWRSKNKDKVKEANRRYWLKKVKKELNEKKGE